MKWWRKNSCRENDHSSYGKGFSMKVVSICLLLVVFQYSCSKTATGLWVGAGVGWVTMTPVGYFALANTLCKQCSRQEDLSDKVYTAIGLGFFGLVVGGVVGSLLGNYFEEDGKTGLVPDLKVVDVKTELVELYFAACRLGDIKVVEKLLTMHPNYITSVDPENWTGLHWTVRLGYKRASETLLLYGADINATDFVGRTPLHHTAINQQLELYQYLVEEGAKVDLRDKKGKRASDYIELNNLQYKSWFNNSSANANADIGVATNTINNRLSNTSTNKVGNSDTDLINIKENNQFNKKP